MGERWLGREAQRQHHEGHDMGHLVTQPQPNDHTYNMFYPVSTIIATASLLPDTRVTANI